MLIEPGFRNLLHRRRIDEMEFGAPSPERDDQIGLDQDVQVFAAALTAHAKVATKLTQGLTIVGV